MEVSSHEDSASEFCCVRFIFSMKLLGVMSGKYIPLLPCLQTIWVSDRDSRTV